jgi:hypothetical protein
MMRLCCAMMMLATCLVTVPASGQPSPSAPALQVGDRVRVTYPTDNKQKSFDGNLLRLSADSLVVTETWGRVQAWPWPGVTQLERSLGRHGSSGKGALVGALVGLGAGIVAGVAVSGDEGFFSGGSTSDAVAAAAIVTLTGTLLGTLVGEFVRVDDWELVPLQQVSPQAPATGGGSAPVAGPK